MVVGCDSAYVNAGLYNSGNTTWIGDYPSCGDEYGAPACVGNGQRNYFLLNSMQFTANLNNCASNAGGPTSVWNVVFYQSQIRLPDGNAYDLLQGNDGQSEISGHYFACP